MATTTWTRRDFVKASALAYAGAPFVGAAAQGPADQPAGTYRACVIGHTGRGSYGHGLDMAFRKIPNVTVVGVADPDEKGRLSTARRTGAARAYADYRAMLEKERPHLVAICPYYPERRLEMTQAAVEVGAHVFVEKPMAVSVAEADAMVAAVEKHRLRAAVGHPMRLAPAVVHLKKLLGDGLIGDLLEMRARGKEDSRAGGEDLIVCGWHCHYLMRFFAGGPLWCSARVTQGGREITLADRRAGSIPLGPVAGDSVQASYAFPGGVQGYFASQKGHARGNDFQIVLYGTKGVAQIHIGPEPRIFCLADPLWSPGKSGKAWQPLPGAPGSADPALGLRADPANQRRLVMDLIRVVETGGQSVASCCEGRAVLEMIMAVYASHLAGGRAALPLKQRSHPLGVLGDHANHPA
jgi:predicted dehydrogenase